MNVIFFAVQKKKKEPFSNVQPVFITEEGIRYLKIHHKYFFQPLEGWRPLCKQTEPSVKCDI